MLKIGDLSARALIFDLDGTLVDSIEDIAAAARRTMRDFADFSMSTAQMLPLVGRGAPHLIRQLWLEQFGQLPSENQQQQAYRQFMQHYSQQGTTLSRLYPQCVEMLQTLAANHIPCALCTNKPIKIARQVLADFNIAPFFQVSYGADSVATPKPAADMLLKAAAVIEVNAQDCIMIGDSINDIGSARAASMPVIALEGGYNHGDAIASQGADLTFASLAQLFAAMRFGS